MKKEKLLVLAAVILMAAGFFVYDTSNASAVQPNLHLNLAAGNHLGQMTIDSDNNLEFKGRSSEPEGTCLPVQIFIDGEREPWWPIYTCVDVGADGAWSLRVPSDDGGEPVDVFFNINE